MELSLERKHDVYKKIALTIADNLENGTLQMQDYQLCSQMVIAGMETVNTEEKLQELLKNLSVKWQFFTKLLLEEGSVNSRPMEKIKNMISVSGGVN